MQTLERKFEIERGSIDLETGKFPLVLASEGEASDGHILNIRGAHIPDKIPLQIAHANSPLETLGSITQAATGTKAGVRVIRAMGEIEMGGEGSQADIRKDLAFMVSEGHVRSISLRAEGTKVIPRRELPKNHRAFVEANEPDMLKRFGMFFEEFTALEGSLVAIGADKNAIVGRANETEGAVQEFWRGFVPDEEETSLQEDVDAVREIIKDEFGELTEDDGDIEVGDKVEFVRFEDIALDTSDIENVRSLEQFLGGMPGISRKEAKRLASIKTETTQPPRDAQEKKRPELTNEEIREAVRGELSKTMPDIHKEVSDIISDALGRVRVR